jgi:hypothetical protein
MTKREYKLSILFFSALAAIALLAPATAAADLDDSIPLPCYMGGALVPCDEIAPDAPIAPDGCPAEQPPIPSGGAVPQSTAVDEGSAPVPAPVDEPASAVVGSQAHHHHARRTHRNRGRQSTPAARLSSRRATTSA